MASKARSAEELRLRNERTGLLVRLHTETQRADRLDSRLHRSEEERLAAQCRVQHLEAEAAEHPKAGLGIAIDKDHLFSKGLRVVNERVLQNTYKCGMRNFIHEPAKKMSGWAGRVARMRACALMLARMQTKMGQPLQILSAFILSHKFGHFFRISVEMSGLSQPTST